MEPITFRCTCCRRILRRNPRVKNQRYCGDRRCQQARKNKWQREKLRTDSEYQADKKASQQIWVQNNPDYWKEYRHRHPERCKRNRQLQMVRDRRRANAAGNVSHRHDLVKKDTLSHFFNDTTVSYFLCPAGDSLVKKDALAVKIIPISTG